MLAHNQTSLEISEAKDINISCYKNCWAKTSKPITIQKLLELIQTGNGFITTVELLRNTTDENKIDQLKKQLPAVALSGLYESDHKAESLIRYSGLIQIDIDKPANRVELKAKLSQDKFSFAVFDSPTKTGIKAIVRVSGNSDKHINNFNSLSRYYQKNYSISIDEKCKDVSRLMFLTFDENLFVNYNAAIWDNPINEKQVFENMLKWLSQTNGEKFIKGNRNNFIYKLSAACFRNGVSENFTLSECLKQFKSADLDEKAITATVKSGYSSKSYTSPINGKKELVRVKKPEAKQKNFSHIARVENHITSKYELRFNEVSLEVEYRKTGTKEPYAILNENNLLRELLHLSINLSKDKLTSLLASDFVKPYNPFTDYFVNLGTWNELNEPDYILKLASYLPVKDEERFKKHFKKMFVRCIACALEDTVFNKQAFILVHPEQNSGKSTFCRWLCPPVLKAYITENFSVDKDSLIALTQNFLINLDELAILSRSEINALKSVFSKDKVKVRAPYERKAVTKPRRANFLGSTNKEEFLTDETGSVRFLCFELIAKIKFNYQSEININDVWRQAYSLYKSNFHYQLTVEEIAENEIANRNYQMESSELQLIQKKFLLAKKADKDALFLTATEILNELYIANPNLKLTAQAVGKALASLHFEKDSRYNETTGYTIKGYYLKKIET